MIDSNINTIVFDLGGVLVDWNPKYVYKDVFKGDMHKVDWFLNNVCTPSWNIEQDAGRTIEEAVILKTNEFPQYKKEIEIYYNEWHYMFSGPIEENVSLFKSLVSRPNYKVYALTNWSAEKWDKALELFPFFKDFDGWVVSGQEKTRKPFDDIYNILIKRFRLTGPKTLFIDDNAENAAAAKNIGINAIHYKNPAQLLDEFKKFGIVF